MGRAKVQRPSAVRIRTRPTQNQPKRHIKLHPNKVYRKPSKPQPKPRFAKHTVTKKPSKKNFGGFNNKFKKTFKKAKHVSKPTKPFSLVQKAWASTEPTSLKTSQQNLSNKYGVTTYNVDGSVSTQGIKSKPQGIVGTFPDSRLPSAQGLSLRELQQGMGAYNQLHTDRPGTTYESRVEEMLGGRGIPPQIKNKSWHTSQKGQLGREIAASKAANPLGWAKATGGEAHVNPNTGSWVTGAYPASGYTSQRGISPAGITRIATQATPVAQRAAKSTWYATSPDGKTWKGKGKLTLQAREYYGDQGIKITSKPPGQDAQQRLSDEHGITTYTQFGDISTTPRDLTEQPVTKLRIEQQKISDKYGVTTYNKDGSVSTIPKIKQQPKVEQASGGWNWFWGGSPEVSAERE